MALDRTVWDQLKNATIERLMSALKADGWERDIQKSGARLVYTKKTYQERLLKSLLHDIGWSEDDLLRLKLIKQKRKPSQETKG